MHSYIIRKEVNARNIGDAYKRESEGEVIEVYLQDKEERETRVRGFCTD